MQFLRKRERPSENVSLAAIGAAITAAFSLLMAFFPSLCLIAVFILPLASALIGFLCQGKYLLPYIIAASFVSFTVSSFNPAEVIFTSIPAVIIGTALGYVSKRKAPGAWELMGVSLIQMAIDIGIAAILKYGFSLDPIATIAKILGMADAEQYESWVLAAIFGISYAQTSITAVFVFALFSSKMGAAKGKKSWTKIVSDSVGIITGALAVVLGFFEKTSAHLFFVLSIPFAAESIANLWGERRPFIYFLLGGFILTSIFLRAGLAASYPDPICLTSFLGVSLDLCALISNLLDVRKER